MKRKNTSVRVRSVLAKAGLILLLAAAVDGSGRAIAQDGVPSGSNADPSDLPPPHQPFTLWDEGPEAIPFDSLTAAEQEAVMEQASRSETNAGYDVAQAWSRYSHEMADLAAAEKARRLAGLTGTDDIGVAP